MTCLNSSLISYAKNGSCNNCPFWTLNKNKVNCFCLPPVSLLLTPAQVHMQAHTFTFQWELRLLCNLWMWFRMSQQVLGNIEPPSDLDRRGVGSSYSWSSLWGVRVRLHIGCIGPSLSSASLPPQIQTCFAHASSICVIYKPLKSGVCKPELCPSHPNCCSPEIPHMRNQETIL